jgi:hypothetical protein
VQSDWILSMSLSHSEGLSLFQCHRGTGFAGPLVAPP